MIDSKRGYQYFEVLIFIIKSLEKNYCNYDQPEIKNTFKVQSSETGRYLSKQRCQTLVSSAQTFELKVCRTADNPGRGHRCIPLQGFSPILIKHQQ